MNSKIIFWKLLPHLPGTKELSYYLNVIHIVTLTRQTCSVNNKENNTLLTLDSPTANIGCFE